jgi:hypothetical protein
VKAVLATVLALAAFVVTHLWIARAADARPELRLLADSVEAQKFRHLGAHADEYELVFVGTSRVLRGFDPAAFEEALGERGLALPAFNFGLLGMGFLEERYVVEWILARRPKKLRWLLIEPTERSAPWIARPIVLGRADELAQRDVAWHTPALVAASLATVWRSNRDFGHKLAFTRSHLLHGLHHLANVGLGAGLFARRFDPRPPPPALPGGFDGRALAPNADEGEVRAPELRVREPEAVDPSTYPWETLAALAARAEAAGVHVRFVVPLTSKSLAPYESAHARGLLPNLALFPPAAFPEVAADPGAWFYDPEHLNEAGARLFSRRLAETLAPEIERERTR